MPITSGGGFMCTRDLARYGQLFCRRGVGIDGSLVGSGAFLDQTRRPPQASKADLEINTGVLSNPGGWYHNAMQSNGKYVGHGGKRLPSLARLWLLPAAIAIPASVLTPLM